MNPIVEALTGTTAMTDEIIATDLLMSVKSAVWNYTVALTETTSSDVRVPLRRHLDEAITLQEEVLQYLATRGYVLPYDEEQQLAHTIRNATTALQL